MSYSGLPLLIRLFSDSPITSPADVYSYAMQVSALEAAGPALPQHVSSAQYNDLSSNNNTGQELVFYAPGPRKLSITALQLASMNPFIINQVLLSCASDSISKVDSLAQALITVGSTITQDSQLRSCSPLQPTILHYILRFCDAEIIVNSTRPYSVRPSRLTRGRNRFPQNYLQSLYAGYSGNMA